MVDVLTGSQSSTASHQGNFGQITASLKASVSLSKSLNSDLRTQLIVKRSKAAPTLSREKLPRL